jgi:hypothetical protein
MIVNINELQCMLGRASNPPLGPANSVKMLSAIQLCTLSPVPRTKLKKQNGRRRSDLFFTIFTTIFFTFFHLLRRTIQRNLCSLYVILLLYHLIMATC